MSLRALLVTLILSLFSFVYVNAQNNTVIGNELHTPTASVHAEEKVCPTAAAQNLLPSESFLNICMEKMLNAVSISALLSEDTAKATTEKACGFLEAQPEI